MPDIIVPVAKATVKTFAPAICIAAGDSNAACVAAAVVAPPLAAATAAACEAIIGFKIEPQPQSVPHLILLGQHIEKRHHLSLICGFQS